MQAIQSVFSKKRGLLLKKSEININLLKNLIKIIQKYIPNFKQGNISNLNLDNYKLSIKLKNKLLANELFIIKEEVKKELKEAGFKVSLLVIL